MKIVGLITEYNPFHNGHKYHLEKAKEVSGADCAIAAMSGDFVQRGLPAICDKYSRCKAALTGGVDAVFELPTFYATSSAERFAAGAVCMLADLGVTDIVYGCEGFSSETLGASASQTLSASASHDLNAAFKKLARLLVEEPEEYRENLKKNLSEGMSFPTARLRAVETFDCDLSKLLNSPNNILGVEYEKAIIRGGFDITTHQIIRNDEGYHASGSAIRDALNTNSIEDIQKLLPKESACEITYTIDAEDFSEVLFYKLLGLSGDELTSYYEVTPEIAARIKRFEMEADGSFYRLATLASAKNITESAVRRALIHILLDVREETLSREAFANASFPKPSYARLLGFNNASGIMPEIKKRATLPIITKFADADPELVKIDCHAAKVYNQIVRNSADITLPDEYHAGVIII